MSRLDPKHQRYRLGHKMGHSAHCRVLLCKPSQIPEIEYYQKVSPHAQIGPQGAEKHWKAFVVGGWYEVITVKDLFDLLNTYEEVGLW